LQPSVCGVAGSQFPYGEKGRETDFA